jgi:hypothetical protein
MTDTSDTGAADGLAALSLCESLLLALGDLAILSAGDIDDVLETVAERHRKAADIATCAVVVTSHRTVIAHIERIRAGGNSGP